MENHTPSDQNNSESLSMDILDFESMRLNLASPEEILSWSYAEQLGKNQGIKKNGEVTKPETINYRTQKAEKDGLFSEKIFGPVKDYECACGKYKKIRYKGIVCDKCGTEVTKSSVRRERMGYIELAVPVAHIWFLKNIPSRIALVIDQPLNEVEKVVYYSSYIITSVNEDLKKDYIKQVENEYKKKLSTITVTGNADDDSVNELKRSKDEGINQLNSLRKWNILSEIDYRIISMKFGGVFVVETGSEVLRRIFSEIDMTEFVKELEIELADADGIKAQKIIKKIRFFGGMLKANVRPEWMFMTHLPVIPPDLRPIVALDGSRFATSDLNDLYRSVISRNNRLKRFIAQKSPEVIVRNEKRMLQEAVDTLIDNSMRRSSTSNLSSIGQKRTLKSMADFLKGKSGRFRQNLLGKRVDYSGRSVIVVGPNLKIDECGIPKKMALELFKPFIINQLIERELAHNIRSATKLIDQGIDEVWDILEKVIENRYVLLNRAPTLHRLSIQAFKPVLIEGKAIQLNPMVCSPFNADFDGDQMAVHIPLSEESLKEAEELMLSSKNLIKPSDGSPSSAPSQDMVLGVYYATTGIVSDKKYVFATFDDAIKAYEHEVIGYRDLFEVRRESKVNNDKIETTMGRIFFNEILPEEFEFVNKVVDKKILKGILTKAFEQYDQPKVGELLDKIKKFGFREMTNSGLSWGIKDFTVSKEKDDLIYKAQNMVDMVNEQYTQGLLTKQEQYNQIVDVWTKTNLDVAEVVRKDVDPKGPVFSMIDSGARGSWGQLTQMAGMKGLVVSPSGKIIETPITSSFLKGLTELEYFISTHGARKGLVDTALKTAASGYLTRRLVDVSQDVVIIEEDCHDSEGMYTYRNDAEITSDSFENFIYGRTLLEDILDPKSNKVIAKSGDLIDRVKAKQIDGTGIDKIRLRSLVSCKSIRGVCQSCYGIDLGRNQQVKLGEAVGIVTAQSIGEPGTQLTMRTFHQGGSAGAADVTKGLPRVEEIFEARTPKTQAIMSPVSGTVVDIIESAGEVRIKIRVDSNVKDSKNSNVEIKEISTDAVTDLVIVKIGYKINVGDPLTEGHLDLEKLYNKAGIESLTRYIVRQILEVYNSQGAGISTKHVEMVVRQMTSRYNVLEPGKSEYLKGQLITRDQLNEYNNNVESEEDKIQFEPLLQGITKVSLNTESFLSAASFQNTTKVLIDASLFGKEDRLRGLKENVIIGKLIPAGTGFGLEKKDYKQE